jgi:type I site-specific restriction-modification system R (restriction) subunit
MQLNDTIKLLKECDSGTKMAVSSMDEVLDKVENQSFKAMLIACKDKHTNLGNEIHSLLKQCNEQDKEPNPMAKGMSWLKTNVKMTIDESDKTIADLMTEGCNMGTKALSRNLNNYVQADDQSKKICKELIRIEDELAMSIRCFL